MEERKPIIQVKNLRVVYDQNEIETVAVENLSLDIYNGEVTVIMGKSGCGKSSLLNTIGGIKNLLPGIFFIMVKALLTMGIQN